MRLTCPGADKLSLTSRVFRQDPRINDAISKDHWLPRVEVARDSNAEPGLRLDTVAQLVPYLRVAYCAEFCIDLRWTHHVGRPDNEVAYGAVFGDLIVPSTRVDVLIVCVDDGTARNAVRKFQLV